MITQKYIEELSGPAEKYFTFIKYFLLFAIALSIVSSAYNLYLGISYASPDKLNITTAINLWNTEIPLNGTYSGYEHHSIIRLNNSILSIGVALVLTIQLISISKTRKRNKRILASLKECGALSGEITNA